MYLETADRLRAKTYCNVSTESSNRESQYQKITAVCAPELEETVERTTVRIFADAPPPPVWDESRVSA